MSARVAALRLARAYPRLTAGQIAARAGCHPSTVERHLRGVRRRPGPAPSAAPFAADAVAAVPAGELLRIALETIPPLPGSDNGPGVAVTADGDDYDAAEHLEREHRELLEDPVRRRQRAALNHDCPPGVLAQLARDSDPSVRYNVACNRSAGPGLVDVLAADPSTDLRIRVAVNATAAKTLLALIRDPEFAVRQTVCDNARCPPAVLRRAAADPDSGVRAAAARNPAAGRTVAARASRGANSDRWAAVTNTACPPSVLAHIAGSEIQAVRVAVAGHPACPPDVLRRLARDSTVRWAVATNPACPPGLLRQFDTDTDHTVRAEAARNPNHPRRRHSGRDGGQAAGP